MYEFKKFGEIFTSKFVGTEPSSYEKKKNSPDRGLTRIEKHCYTESNIYWITSSYVLRYIFSGTYKFNSVFTKAI